MARIVWSVTLSCWLVWLAGAETPVRFDTLGRAKVWCLNHGTDVADMVTFYNN